MDINYHHGDYNISDRWDSVDYIVVHYTGSGSSNYPCALNNCQYFAGGDRSASAHYFIDDSGIYEYADPDEYATWHCGDGHGMYGITNANSVGIEVCSSGEDFTDEEIEYLRQLVTYLMDRYDIDVDHVVRHYDASGKHCPAPYIDWDRWVWLRSIITSGEHRESEDERRQREEAERRAKEIREMQPVTNEGGDVYRLYNPNNGNHMFTTNISERDALVQTGWTNEGVAWTAHIGQYAIYRLYNPGNGDHLLTTNFDEAKSCVEAGWNYEGVPFMSSKDGADIFRLYNPYSGQHMYTSSSIERDNLCSVGWKAEGSFTA